MAKRLGLITVDERRIGYRYNDSNRVRIVSREWLAWLAHGQKETVRNLTTTSNQYFHPGKSCRGERRASDGLRLGDSPRNRRRDQR